MTGFISDVHGNLAALEAVLERLDALGVTEIYSLGDIAGYYPQLNECAAALQARGIRHILGNHDAYLLGTLDCTRSTTVSRTIAYQQSVASKGTLAWLAASATAFDEPHFFAVHGGVNNYLDEYVAGWQFPADIKQHLFLTGHTHIQKLLFRGDRTTCNPGSVGQPRDSDPRAAFAVLKDNGEVELHRTTYDIAATAAASKAAGFEPLLTDGLFTGERIGAHDNNQ